MKMQHILVSIIIFLCCHVLNIIILCKLSECCQTGTWLWKKAFCREFIFIRNNMAQK